MLNFEEVGAYRVLEVYDASLYCHWNPRRFEVGLADVERIMGRNYNMRTIFVAVLCVAPAATAETRTGIPRCLICNTVS